MRNFRIFTGLTVLLLASLASACASKANPMADQKAVTPSNTAVKDFEDFDRSKFTQPTIIDHKWYPFNPGTQFVYEGTTREDFEEIHHRVVVTVTDLTKVIDGVRCRVNFIYDFSAGQVVEAELAFFAQDDDGNVWRMGEHPEVYENGVFVEAPTWISGIKDAWAGIAMLADPRLGTPSYSQGWGPGVGFTDRGQVAESGLQVCTPLRCFGDVIAIRENSREEPNAFQFKYYAPGAYNIRVDWKGADQKQEVLELVEIINLGSQTLADMRTKAIELEKHAYQISPDVYGLTQPME